MGLQSLNNDTGKACGHLMKYTKTASFVAATALKSENLFSGPCHVFGILVDATANSTEDVYVKLYDATSITLGTTVPIYVFKVTKSTLAFLPLSLDRGIYFENGLTVAVVTAGGTGGTTGVTDGVNIEVFGKRGRPVGWDAP